MAHSSGGNIQGKERNGHCVGLGERSTQAGPQCDPRGTHSPPPTPPLCPSHPTASSSPVLPNVSTGTFRRAIPTAAFLTPQAGGW